MQDTSRCAPGGVLRVWFQGGSCAGAGTGSTWRHRQWARGRGKWASGREPVGPGCSQGGRAWRRFQTAASALAQEGGQALLLHPEAL